MVTQWKATHMSYKVSSAITINKQRELISAWKICIDLCTFGGVYVLWIDLLACRVTLFFQSICNWDLFFLKYLCDVSGVLRDVCIYILDTQKIWLFLSLLLLSIFLPFCHSQQTKKQNKKLTPKYHPVLPLNRRLPTTETGHDLWQFALPSDVHA